MRSPLPLLAIGTTLGLFLLLLPIAIYKDAAAIFSLKADLVVSVADKQLELAKRAAKSIAAGNNSQRAASTGTKLAWMTKNPNMPTNILPESKSRIFDRRHIMDQKHGKQKSKEIIEIELLSDSDPADGEDDPWSTLPDISSTTNVSVVSSESTSPRSLSEDFKTLLWKFHPWTSVLAAGQMDRHTCSERLAISGLSWSGSITVCGMYLSENKSTHMSIVVGIASVFAMLPAAKLLNYVIARCNSPKKERIRRREPRRYPKAPPLPNWFRMIVMFLIAGVIGATVYLNIINGLRLGVDDTREMEWAEAILCGHLVGGLVIEPLLIFLDMKVAKVSWLSWIAPGFRAAMLGSDGVCDVCMAVQI